MGLVEDSGYSEISQLEGVVFGNKNILAFDVAVEDLAVMHVLDRQADLGEPIQDVRFLEKLLLGFSLRDGLGQVPTLCVFHHDL